VGNNLKPLTCDLIPALSNFPNTPAIGPISAGGTLIITGRDKIRLARYGTRLGSCQLLHIRLFDLLRQHTPRASEAEPAVAARSSSIRCFIKSIQSTSWRKIGKKARNSRIDYDFPRRESNLISR
jgi:hypothetical protein